MKKSTVIPGLLLAGILIQGCVKDTLQSTYTYLSPVYKSRTEVLKDIKSVAPLPIQQTGKLYVRGNFLFVNEVNKGVHVIDNSNPTSPRNISFISIPGNLDIAVKNNILFADLFTDMISIDITDPLHATVKKVIKGIFPERYTVNGLMPDSTKYIVDWIKQTTTEKKTLDQLNQQQPGQQMMWFSASQSNSTGGSKASGVGGSMARFAVVNNYLYTVGQSQLSAINISDAGNPQIEKVQFMGMNIETIYPIHNKLFIGSQTGMFIYSISNPANPTLLSDFSHACFNDPVIADDRYAYITLKATTNVSACRGTIAAQTNELDIVDISNIQQPMLLKIYDMAGPMGLSKDGNHLFICDGKAGLKIYDAANVLELKLLKTIDTIQPFDIICQNGLAIVVAVEGIFQYDYRNIKDIKTVSKITINK